MRERIIEEIIGECERQIGKRRFEFDIRQNYTVSLVKLDWEKNIRLTCALLVM